MIRERPQRVLVKSRVDLPNASSPTRKDNRRAAEFHIEKGSTGKYRFVLVASNGEPVATSELYESKSGAKKGAEACKRATAEAEIVDDTD
ncbi:MAG: YegP family protein [Actinomycetota bacterium]